MSDDKVLMELMGAEALVLFEFLTGWDRSGKPAFGDETEGWALTDPYRLPEEAMAGPFAANGTRLPRGAREQVRDGREW